MTRTVKLMTLTCAGVLSVSLLGGCATDQEARDAAKAAMDAANAAQACCDANEERVNRMYQKIMSK